MDKLHSILLWTAPVLLYSADTYAWGLYTHLYFTQLLIWSIPLADPRLRRAIKKFPNLVLAGACLPDLSLFSKIFKEPAFSITHQWSTGRRLFNAAESDEDLAMALGFNSHLLVDVIAHNHFVPNHQEIWFDHATVTHAISEWAMDAHIARHAVTTPFKLLRCEAKQLIPYVVNQFGCSENHARKSLTALAFGDRLLRFSQLPRACYWGGITTDKTIRSRFDYYLNETHTHLKQINRVLAGESPIWHPEIYHDTNAPAGTPLPQDLF
jgi:hypothetical protein